MLYIRTDMNETIATGHMMRCLSVADAAKKRGEDTIFLVSDGKGEDLLKKRGYGCQILHTSWNDMEAELPVLFQLIRQLQMKKLLVDSYQVTSKYLEKLSTVVKTYYMDDLNAFIYPVNGLICYANYWETCNYPERYPDVNLYLGLEYIPLREAFVCCEKKVVNPEVKNLLLMSGGSDPYDILSKLLGRLDKNLYEEIHIICGLYNTKYDDLKQLCRQYPNIHVQKAVEDIETYMKQADLAVSAGGTTLYELCAVGTPTISYSFADNQLDNVRTFQKEGIIDYAGDVREGDVVSEIISLVGRYRKHPALRCERSEKMQKLVDGKGAGRIAEILSEGKETGRMGESKRALGFGRDR